MYVFVPTAVRLLPPPSVPAAAPVPIAVRLWGPPGRCNARPHLRAFRTRTPAPYVCPALSCRRSSHVAEAQTDHAREVEARMKDDLLHGRCETTVYHSPFFLRRQREEFLATVKTWRCARNPLA